MRVRSMHGRWNGVPAVGAGLRLLRRIGIIVAVWVFDGSVLTGLLHRRGEIIHHLQSLGLSSPGLHRRFRHISYRSEGRSR